MSNIDENMNENVNNEDINENAAENAENVDAVSPNKKKKLTGYALVRVIMMCFFAAAFVVFATISVGYLIRNYKADKLTGEVMGGFNEISRPNITVDSNPLIFDETPAIPPIETPEETPVETPEETPGETPVETPIETPKETLSEEEKAFREYIDQCLAEVKKMKETYPDFIGFIVIEGDTINFKHPILQSDDNQYYVNHLIDGTKNTSGEVFMDFRNKEDILSNRNSVLYGHNMNNGTKFGQLKLYKKNNAFYTHNITIITEEGVMTFVPFSFYKTTIHVDYTRILFRNDSEFAEFCTSEQNKSMFESNFTFTGKEKIITLSTCYGTSDTERYCLHAVLVDISK